VARRGAEGRRLFQRPGGPEEAAAPTARHSLGDVAVAGQGQVQCRRHAARPRPGQGQALGRQRQERRSSRGGTPTGPGRTQAGSGRSAGRRRGLAASDATPGGQEAVRHFPVAGLLAALLVGVAAGGLSAQGATDTSTVDRIMAVVGNKAILFSQVQEEIYARVSEHKERLPDASKEPDAFAQAMTVMMRRYVDTLVAFELLYNEAATDTTIKVTDQEVNDAADQMITNARKTFKTEAEFQAQLHDIGFKS